MEKCSVIKSDKGSHKCPFGLPITEACEHAGNSPVHMCPLSEINEDKKERVRTANLKVYVYYKTNERCIYAADIMKERGSVNCDQGSSAAGLHHPGFQGSALYPQTFGVGSLNLLNAYPLGYYNDNSQMTNMPFGQFSLQGEEEFDIIKMAKENK